MCTPRVRDGESEGERGREGWVWVRATVQMRRSRHFILEKEKMTGRQGKNSMTRAAYWRLVEDNIFTPKGSLDPVCVLVPCAASDFFSIICAHTVSGQSKVSTHARDIKRNRCFCSVRYAASAVQTASTASICCFCSADGIDTLFLLCRSRDQRPLQMPPCIHYASSVRIHPSTKFTSAFPHLLRFITTKIGVMFCEPFSKNQSTRKSIQKNYDIHPLI